MVLMSLIVIISSCNNRDDYKSVPTSVRGYKPVYYDINSKLEDSIISLPPRALLNPGKIYVYQSYLLINEQGRGIHVYDNSDPTTPIPISFINIPYNLDIAVKDDVLFGDTYFGLVVIDISGLPAITLVKIMKYSQNQVFPQLPRSQFLGGWRDNSARVYFECIDPSKGVVIDWEETQLINPKCHKNFN